MINNKGQSLALFVIVLPIILVLFGVIIEYVFIAYNKVHFYSVTKTIIANCIDTKEKNDIIELYNDNKIELHSLDVIVSEGLEIKASQKLDSFLGKFINKDTYVVSVDIKGYKENNRIKYKKG